MRIAHKLLLELSIITLVIQSVLISISTKYCKITFFITEQHIYIFFFLIFFLIFFISFSLYFKTPVGFMIIYFLIILFSVYTSRIFTEIFFPFQKLDIIYQADFIQIRRI